MSELRDLLAKSKLQIGASQVAALSDSNSLPSPGPFSKQNYMVLFSFNDFTQFCK